MSRPASRPGSPGLGSSPRGSVVNLQQYAADAKISSHRGEDVTTGLMNGEQKAQAAPTNSCECGRGRSGRVSFARCERQEECWVDSGIKRRKKTRSNELYKISTAKHRLARISAASSPERVRSRLKDRLPIIPRSSSFQKYHPHLGRPFALFPRVSRQISLARISRETGKTRSTHTIHPPPISSAFDHDCTVCCVVTTLPHLRILGFA